MGTHIDAWPLSVHDDLPEEAGRIVDMGLGDYNDRAAPLHEVRPLACLIRNPSGRVVAGLVGRRWGACAEVQQLWVDDAMRGQGLGRRLMAAFERQAAGQGCTSLYLETFSFQAPGFYRALGWCVAYERHGYPHDIVKYHFCKDIGAASSGG